MRWFLTVLGVLFGIAVFLFLDYALPSRQTVRITNTYNRLTSVTASNAIFYASDNTGTVENAAGQRDVRFEHQREIAFLRGGGRAEGPGEPVAGRGGEAVQGVRHGLHCAAPD